MPPRDQRPLDVLSIVRKAYPYRTLGYRRRRYRPGRDNNNKRDRTSHIASPFNRSTSLGLIVANLPIILFVWTNLRSVLFRCQLAVHDEFFRLVAAH